MRIAIFGVEGQLGADVQTALAALITSGHSYEWGGMIWHQGESDAGSVSNANLYQANFYGNTVDRISCQDDDDDDTETQELDPFPSLHVKCRCRQQQ